MNNYKNNNSHQSLIESLCSKYSSKRSAADVVNIINIINNYKNNNSHQSLIESLCSRYSSKRSAADVVNIINIINIIDATTGKLKFTAILFHKSIIHSMDN